MFLHFVKHNYSLLCLGVNSKGRQEEKASGFTELYSCFLSFFLKGSTAWSNIFEVWILLQLVFTSDSTYRRLHNAFIDNKAFIATVNPSEGSWSVDKHKQTETYQREDGNVDCVVVLVENIQWERENMLMQPPGTASVLQKNHSLVFLFNSRVKTPATWMHFMTSRSLLWFLRV